MDEVCGVPNRTDAGGHRTPDESDDVERSVVTDLDGSGFGHDNHFGERGNSEVVVNYFAILREAARSVIEDSVRSDDVRHHLALGGATEKAVTTVPTVGNPG
ncbi:unannotated protein [freshwater metagenome]|uniref:Unannotated protein n=1 Tax=freshwater metagenome TaxID=449393 RepID=A0A6J6F575_9ZZZZ